MDSVSLFSNQFLMELVVKGTLLMSLAFAVTFLLRKKSAALRHAVWSLAFIGLLLLPAGAALLPTWYVPLPATEPPAETITPQLSAPSRPAGETGTYTDVPAGTFLAETPVSESNWSWTAIALFAWVAGAMVLLLKMAIVLNKLALVRRSAIPVTDPEWTALAEALPDVLGVRRPVVLLQHEEVHVPMTYGVRRPVILLPIQVDGWSADQKRITLMHELLHVRRLDYVVHIMALAARALHWFNPLAWLAAKKLVVERERACDDGVLALGVASTSYADHLLDMARFVLSGNEASTAALAMARPSELRSRVVAILNPGLSRHGLTPFRALSLTASALVVVLLVAAAQPGHPPAKPITSDTAQSSAVIEAPETLGEALREVATVLALDSADVVEEDIEESREEPADTSGVDAQRQAIFAISQLPEERSVPLLREIAEKNANPRLREEAVFWLGQVGGDAAAEILMRFARNDENVEVRKKAIFSLSELEGAAGSERLIELARTHPDPETQGEAVFWLGQNGGEGVADILLDFARNGRSPEVQKKAIFALSELDEEGIEHLITLARTHPNQQVRSEAVFWLGESGDPRAADILMDIVNGK